jgi:hypothetical protein
VAVRRPTYRDVQPVRVAVTYEEMMEAKVFMDTVGNELGFLRARVEYDEEVLKIIFADEASKSDETSNDRRAWAARASMPYRQQALALFQTRQKYSQLDTLFRVANTKIEIWRTISANERIREQSPDSTRERRS